MARPAVVLPEPDSPTRPTTSPVSILKDDVVDSLDVADHAGEDAALNGEVIFELVDFQQVAVRLAFCGWLPLRLNRSCVAVMRVTSAAS